MALSVRSAASGGAGSSSTAVRVSMPATIAAGDVGVVFIAGDGKTLAPASGWTEQKEFVNASTGSVTSLSVYTKPGLTSTNAGELVLFGFSTAADDHRWVSAALAGGADLGSLLNSSTSGFAGNVIASTGFTFPGPNNLVFAAAVHDNDFQGTGIGTPLTFTQLSYAAQQGNALLVAYRALSSSGAVGTVTFSTNNSSAAWIALCLGFTSAGNGAGAFAPGGADLAGSGIVKSVGAGDFSASAAVADGQGGINAITGSGSFAAGAAALAGDGDYSGTVTADIGLRIRRSGVFRDESRFRARGRLRVAAIVPGAGGGVVSGAPSIGFAAGAAGLSGTGVVSHPPGTGVFTAATAGLSGSGLVTAEEGEEAGTLDGSNIPLFAALVQTAGTEWTLVGGVVYRDGVPTPSSTVDFVSKIGNAINQHIPPNATFPTGGWWAWNETTAAWVQQAASPHAVSPSGTTTASASRVFDSLPTNVSGVVGNCWILISGNAYRNGVLETGSGAVTEIFFWENRLYREDNSADYFIRDPASDTWLPVAADPRDTPPPTGTSYWRPLTGVAGTDKARLSFANGAGLGFNYETERPWEQHAAVSTQALYNYFYLIGVRWIRFMYPWMPAGSSSPFARAIQTVAHYKATIGEHAMRAAAAGIRSVCACTHVYEKTIYQNAAHRATVVQQITTVANAFKELRDSDSRYNSDLVWFATINEWASTPDSGQLTTVNNHRIDLHNTARSILGSNFHLVINPFGWNGIDLLTDSLFPIPSDTGPWAVDVHKYPGFSSGTNSNYWQSNYWVPARNWSETHGGRPVMLGEFSSGLPDGSQSTSEGQRLALLAVANGAPEMRGMIWRVSSYGPGAFDIERTASDPHILQSPNIEAAFETARQIVAANAG